MAMRRVYRNDRDNLAPGQVLLLSGRAWSEHLLAFQIVCRESARACSDSCDDRSYPKRAGSLHMIFEETDAP